MLDCPFAYTVAALFTFYFVVYFIFFFYFIRPTLCQFFVPVIFNKIIWRECRRRHDDAAVAAGVEAVVKAAEQLQVF